MLPWIIGASVTLACGAFMLKSHFLSQKRDQMISIRASFSSSSAPTKLDPLSHPVTHCTSAMEHPSAMIKASVDISSNTLMWMARQQRQVKSRPCLFCALRPWLVEERTKTVHYTTVERW